MTLRKAAINSAIATSIKLISGLLTIKLLAMMLGVEGFGRIANAFSVIGIINSVSICGISLGVTRYVSQYKNDLPNLSNFLGTAHSLTVISSIALGIFGYSEASEISLLLFNSEDFKQIIQIAACLILPVGYASLLLAIINGLSETKLLVAYQFGGLVIGSGGLIFLTINFGQQGAVIGLVWLACSPIVLIPFLFKKWKTIFKAAAPKLSIYNSNRLLRYTGAMLITVVAQNFIQIYFRDTIADFHGFKQVGYWQGITRISDAYLQMFNVLLVGYLLPKLSETNDKSEVKDVIAKVYKLLAPAMLVTFLVIYILRNVLIEIVLTDEFKMVSELFAAQMLADFFRILSYVPGFLVLARGYIPLLIVADPAQVLLLYVAGKFLIPNFGALGACYAYAFAFIIYFLVSALLFRIYEKRC